MNINITFYYYHLVNVCIILFVKTVSYCRHFLYMLMFKHSQEVRNCFKKRDPAASYDLVVVVVVVVVRPINPLLRIEREGDGKRNPFMDVSYYMDFRR